MADKRKTDTKERVLALTLAEIQRGGYRDLTLRGLAKKFGISATALYNHFENKENLFDEALARLSALVFQEYSAGKKQLADSGDAVTQFLFLSEYILEKFQAEPLLMHFLFFSPSALKVYAKKNNAVPFWAEARRIILNIQKEKQLPISLEQLYTPLWAYMQGYTILVTSGIAPYNRALLERGIHLLLQELPSQNA